MRKILVGTIMVAAMAASGTASAEGGAAHIDDCTNATGATLLGYPTGCSFGFADGNGTPTAVVETKYKDTISKAGNETEVFIGNGLANDTGLVVTYNAASNPFVVGQTCLSFATGNMTPTWTMTIQTTGEWNLTCNFSKS